MGIGFDVGGDNVVLIGWGRLLCLFIIVLDFIVEGKELLRFLGFGLLLILVGSSFEFLKLLMLDDKFEFGCDEK